MNEAEQIAAFIAARGVTRCPTVALVETAFIEIDPADVKRREEYERQRRLLLVEKIARKRGTARR